MCIAGLCGVQKCTLLSVQKVCIHLSGRCFLISVQYKCLCTFLTDNHTQYFVGFVFDRPDNLQSPPSGLTRGTSIVIHASYGFTLRRHLTHLFGHLQQKKLPSLWPPDTNTRTQWRASERMWLKQNNSFYPSHGWFSAHNCSPNPVS